VEVRYTLTLDEYVECAVHAYRKAGVGRASYLLLWFIVPVLCTGGAMGLWQYGGAMRPIAIGLALAAGVFLVVYPFLHRAAIRRNLRACAERAGTHGVTGPITLILSEDALTEITETGRSEVKWADMAGIEVVGDRTYIYASGASAAVIPRSGFATGAEYEAVRDFALRKLADRVR
jgi:hypothetical protein